MKRLLIAIIISVLFVGCANTSENEIEKLKPRSIFEEFSYIDSSKPDFVEEIYYMGRMQIGSLGKINNFILRSDKSKRLMLSFDKMESWTWIHEFEEVIKGDFIVDFPLRNDDFVSMELELYAVDGKGVLSSYNQADKIIDLMINLPETEVIAEKTSKWSYY